MKIMVTWKLHPGKLHETLGVFAAMTPEQEEDAMGPNVKFLGRWHDLTRGRGTAILESDDPQALSAYALRWNATMDLDISVVLDDEEARNVARSMS